MRSTEWLACLDRAGLRHLVAGTDTDGVVAGLDLEGRLFLVYDGEVISRVNPDALVRPLQAGAYQLPGGDGLWPAPEGTRLGYQYATGRWRVPPGIAAARFHGERERDGGVAIRAEIDLVNNTGHGLPLAFERRIAVERLEEGLAVRVTESMEYLGARPLGPGEALLAPWSLSQFPCAPGCEVVFPAAKDDVVWDLYDPSPEQRTRNGEYIRLRADGILRYQVGIGPETPWIEFRDPGRRLAVRRVTHPDPGARGWIDIADAPPDQPPAKRATRYSVYVDAGSFMEAEAVGTFPGRLEPGVRLTLRVDTLVSRWTPGVSESTR